MCKIQQNRRWSLVKSVPYVLEWPGGGVTGLPPPPIFNRQRRGQYTNRPKIHLHHRRTGLAFTSREDERFSLRMNGRKQYSRTKIDVLQVHHRLWYLNRWRVTNAVLIWFGQETTSRLRDIWRERCIYVGVRYFPKGEFPSGDFPNVQFPKRQLPKG